MNAENAYFSELYKAGDRLLLGVLGALLLVSLALAPWYHTWAEALVIGVPAWAVCAQLARTQGGTQVTRCAIAAALMVLAGLHIHQAHGLIEAHFEIFVLLAFLLYYRDWLPLVVAAGVVAVHHLAFDLLQRYGQPVWVFAAEGGIGIVLLHAAFVVFETALLVWMAVKLRDEISATGGDPRALSAAARELADGNLEVKIATEGATEASLVCAMERMRLELKTNIARERVASEENSRVRTALDRIGMAAMLVDADGGIIYANDAANSLLRARAAAIRACVPQFDPERLVGARLEAVLGGSAPTRAQLVELAGAHNADCVFGDVHLRIVANPVVNQAGVRLGTIVQCQDRTQEVAVEEEIKQAVANASAGDLTARLAEADKDGFFKALAAGMNSLIANLASVIATVKQAAAEVHRGADELSQGSSHLAGRTAQQASSLEQTASSMEEMTSTVKQNADNVARANQLATAARDQAAKGGAVVNQAVHAMTEIDVASNRIADIIGVIDDLAFQTNLLALNAAVEAARAGEQGRGFAVVATEVRTLAGRSAVAARQIKDLIQDSVRKVADGSKLVTQSGETLEQIVTAVKRVTDIVAEISTATHEQSAGIEQVNKALMHLDELTQQNSALVEESSAASQAIAEQAHSLNEHVGRYHIGAGTGAGAASATSARPARPAPGRTAPILKKYSST